MDDNKKKSLIVIDMQEGFRYDNVVSITSKVNEIQKYFDNIIYTKFKNSFESHFFKELNWDSFIEEKDINLLSEINVNPHSTFLIHKTYSIFDKESKKYIIDNHIKEIYLAGIYLDVCVLSLAMDLFDNEIRVKIISDCVTCQDKNHDNICLNSISKVIGHRNVISREVFKI